MCVPSMTNQPLVGAYSPFFVRQCILPGYVVSARWHRAFAICDNGYPTCFPNDFRPGTVPAWKLTYTLEFDASSTKLTWVRATRNQCLDRHKPARFRTKQVFAATQEPPCPLAGLVRCNPGTGEAAGSPLAFVSRLFCLPLVPCHGT